MLCIDGAIWLQEPVLCCVLLVPYGYKSQCYVVCCWCHMATRASVMLCIDGAIWLQEPVLCCALLVPYGYKSQCYVVR